MSVTVRIPTPFQHYTGGREEVTASAGSVAAIMQDLEIRFPGLAARITEEGRVRSFMNIYLNEVDIRTLQAEQTLVRDGDEVLIIPAIAGGSPVAVRSAQ